MTMSEPNDKAQPGQTLAKHLRDHLPPADHLPFLAILEQNSRRNGDLELLREVRAYRQLTGMKPPPIG